MKIIQKTINGKEYDVVVQRVSENIFKNQIGDIKEENGNKEIALSDYRISDEQLPYSRRVSQHICRAIDAGAELILFRQR